QPGIYPPRTLCCRAPHGVFPSCPSAVNRRAACQPVRFGCAPEQGLRRKRRGPFWVSRLVETTPCGCRRPSARLRRRTLPPQRQAQLSAFAVAAPRSRSSCSSRRPGRNHLSSLPPRRKDLCFRESPAPAPCERGCLVEL